MNPFLPLVNIYLLNILLGLSNFLIIYLLIRNIGVDNYGKLVVLKSVFGVISMLFSARTSEVVLRFTKISYERKLKFQIPIIFILSFFTDILLSLFLIFVVYFKLSEIIAVYFLKNPSFKTESIIFSFVAALNILRGTAIGFLMAFEYIQRIYVLELIESLMKIFGIILLYKYLENLNLLNIILVFLFSALAINLMLYIYTLKIWKKYNINAIKSAKLEKDFIKEYYSFLWKTFLIAFLKAGNYNLDRVLISYFLTSYIAGVYDLIRKLFLPMDMLIASIKSFFFPKIISLYIKDKSKLVKQIIIVSSVLSIMCFIYITIGFSYYETFLIYLSNNRNIVIEKNILDLIYISGASFLLVSGIFWWFRNLSGTINPVFSIWSNLLASGYYIAIIILGYYVCDFNEKEQVYFIFLSLIGLNLVLSSYFISISIYWYKESKEKKKDAEILYQKNIQ